MLKYSASNRRSQDSACQQRRGVTLTEVIVVLAVLAVLLLLALLSLPRVRETARTTGCDKNLMSIGLGLGYYMQATGQLPTLPSLPVGEQPPSASAIGAILGTLGIADFGELKPEASPYQAGGNHEPIVGPMGGLRCPSDPNAFDAGHLAPLSYRAVTGDQADGRGGPFEPGKKITLTAIDKADGLAFTACLTERLVGGGPGFRVSLANYQVVLGPLTSSPCPLSTEIRTDAGGNWSRVSWSQSLINHALTPNTPTSCISTDEQTALLSASSGHQGYVHHLMLDGSVRHTSTTVNSRLWKALASLDDQAEPKP